MAETKKTQSKSGSTTKAKAPAKAKPQDRNPPIDIEGGREPVAVKLVGVEYEATPPKGIVALKFARSAKESSKDPEKLIEALTEWLHMAFSEEDAEAIEARLYESHDDLDIVHIVQLIQKMTEMVTGNPTS